MNKNSKGKQKHHKVFLLLMNIESCGNFEINKRLGLKSLNSTQPGHILEKKGSISYEKKGYKKGTFFHFQAKEANFFHFQGVHVFLATLMVIYQTPKIGSGN